MPNALAHETSPYLLQHKDNPVDWRPWGEQAGSEARRRGLPLLVSVGYSACHWCHVMAHESFEDADIAQLMNARFVCVKVDREERPDVDAVCMEACQAMTGHGGWPLNAFLTPDLVPFFAGTYFPPQPGHGLPSWRMVLEAVSEAWRDRREDVARQSERILVSLSATARLQPSSEPIRAELLVDAVAALSQSYDERHGGFGGAPKFPQASVLELLLARGEREMSLGTLRAMAAGGIYDHVGGGFARYAVDATWTVPHFEKMLYDNALLARAYLHGWQASGEERLAVVCCETLDWALREMRAQEGGFHSALDADSEGVEGKFYVWSIEELRAVLGPLATEAIDYFQPQPFEHGYVLEGRGSAPASLPEIRCKLYGARSERVRPGLDDKQLTSWNALMVAALAEAGAVLGRAEYLEAAKVTAAFLLSRRDDSNVLLRTARLPGFLEDYAFLLEALLVLYEASFEPSWYEAAVSVADEMIERFEDSEHGGFFTTAEGQSELPVRRKDLEDSPVPSGNAAAAFGLLRLALLAGEVRYERHALRVLRLLFPLAVRHPPAFGHLLRAADFYLAPVREVAIVGPAEQTAPLLGVIRSRLRPHIVLAAGEGSGGSTGSAAAAGVPLLAGRHAVDGHAAAYVCERFVCQAPVTSAEELEATLDVLPAAP